MDVLVISAVLVCFVPFLMPIPEISMVALIVSVYAGLVIKRNNHDVFKIAAHFVSSCTHFLAGSFVVLYRNESWVHIPLLVLGVVINVATANFTLLDRAFEWKLVAEFVLIVACGAMAEPVWMILTAVAIHSLLLIRSLPPSQPDTHDAHDDPFLKQTPELA